MQKYIPCLIWVCITCIKNSLYVYFGHSAMFQHWTVTNWDWTVAWCLDLKFENVWNGMCGSGGMDGFRRAWSLDKENDSCYWGVGWKAEKRLVRGLLEAVHISPLFTLTPGLQEAQGGHMPNSPGGQSCPALSLTSLPAPLSPVRYMCLELGLHDWQRYPLSVFLHIWI